MNPQTPILTMEDVTTLYGNNEMLTNVSIKIDQGRTVCILGSNGAGKTTLIKAILGLVKIKSGKITFKGEDITGAETHNIVRRGIAIVPEGKRIFPKMTTLENLHMGAFAEGDKWVIGQALSDVFNIFPRLKERTSQIAGTLSGGEQSMLSIGRGLMSNPDLMIFDEPSLGLAPILVEQNFEIIKQINERGTTVLLVEQNAGLTLEIADYGYVLQKGKIIVEGPATELEHNEMVVAAYLS
jgi:branched-chain amino acid transport system ATP-binding protein